jgi:p-hydroxybenzoate 3-monooxygenase
MRTQVCIVGGGPSGLLVGQLLHRAGIDTIVLERRSRAHVLARIRAGVLEDGLCDLLRRAGVGDRMDREGFRHTGTVLAAAGREFRIDFQALTGRSVMVYGQTEVTHDLYAARDEAGGTTHDEIDDVAIEGVDTAAPAVTFRQNGAARRIACDFVAGCDGFHGVSRRTDPAGRAQGISNGSIRSAGSACCRKPRR